MAVWNSLWQKQEGSLIEELISQPASHRDTLIDVILMKMRKQAKPADSLSGKVRSVSVFFAMLVLSTGAGQAQDVAKVDFGSTMVRPSGAALLPGRESLPQAPSAVAATNGLLTPGGTLVPRATAGPLALSLDDAIALGIKSNEQLEQLRIQDRLVRGEILTVFNSLLPSVTATAQSNAQEINLAAMGFKPAALAAFGFAPGTIATIVKVNTTSAQLNVNQILFNLPDYYLYRAAQKARDATTLAVANGRGGVTLSVGTAYLRALADAAQIEDAKALLTSDRAVLRQATLLHEAGVSPNIDVLRARVEEQQQEQVVVQSENNFAKDKIALNRLMGIPAEQELTLTDLVPYADLAETPLADAVAVAYTRRKDLLTLQAQAETGERERKAARAEHLPTLAFGGFYGVLGETTGLYHGVFNAQGTLKIPIFQEAQFRGEREVADAQLTSVRQQIASLRVTIEQQIRANMLDVASTAELVKVARSNVTLATEALDETTQRFKAGVDDSLPVVRAQATLADAQARLIQSLFQNNQSKLNLARSMGVVETQYRGFLGR